MNAFERHRAATRERWRAARATRSGPGSVSWKINGEMIVVAAWGRAILLQLAHPAIAAGVHQHSSFRGSLASSLRRFQSTVGAMLSITFGDTEQMIAAAAGINAIHDRVRGRVCPHTQPPPSVAERPSATYSAHDPDLQRWVHATLIESIPLTYELVVGPLTPRERDHYCAEAAIMEPLLGMPAEWLPRDASQLDAYMREMLSSGRLIVTDTSRALARAVLFPPRWYLVWPAFRLVHLLTFGLLPPSIREEYGFEWRGRDARALARWTTAVRWLRRVTPAFAREWPSSRERRQVPLRTEPHVRGIAH